MASMYPDEEEIREYENKVSFICCTDNGVYPTMWYYSKCSELTRLMTDTNLTVDDEVLGQNCEEDKLSILFLCGKEDNYGTMLYGMGKLLLNTGHERVLLSTEFNPVGGDSDVPNCANAYKLSITPHRLAPEHVMHVTRGSTSVPETVALSTPGSDTTEYSTRPIATTSTGHTSGYTSGTTPMYYTSGTTHIGYTSGTTPMDYTSGTTHFRYALGTTPESIANYVTTIPTTMQDQTEISTNFKDTPTISSTLANSEGFDIFRNDSVHLSALLILVISLLCNVAFGCERFYLKTLKSKNATTNEGNCGRNVHQVSISARNTDDTNDALQMETTEFGYRNMPMSLFQECRTTRPQHPSSQHETKRCGALCKYPHKEQRLKWRQCLYWKPRRCTTQWR